MLLRHASDTYRWVWPGDRSMLSVDTWPVAQSHILSLTALSDGRLVSGDLDGTICISNPADRHVERVLGPLDSPVTALMARPDGLLVTGTLAGTLQIWETNRFSEVGSFKLSRHGIRCFTPLESQRVAFGNDDGVVFVWDIESGTKPSPIATTKHRSVDDDGHDVQYAVTAMTTLGDGRLIVACEYCVLRTLDSATGAAEIVDEFSQESAIGLVAFSDGRFASASSDGSVHYWRGRTPVMMARSEKFGDGATSIVKVPDGRLAVGLKSGVIEVRDPDARLPPVRLERHATAVSQLTTLPDGRLVSTSARTIVVWNEIDSAAAVATASQSCGTLSLAVLSDGRIAAAFTDGSIRLWTKPGGHDAARTGTLIGRHWGAEMTNLSVTADDGLLSGTREGELHLWYVGEPQRVQRLSLATSGLRAAVVLPGDTVAVATFDHDIRLHRIGDNVENHAVLACDSDATALTALGDGNLAAAYEDGSVRVWDVRRRHVRQRLQFRGGAALVLATLPDRRLAVAENNNIFVWDLATGRHTQTLPGSDTIRALAAMPDGWLVSAQGDNTIRFWNLATGRCLTHEVDAGASALLCLGPGELVAGDVLGRLHWLKMK